MKIVYAAILVLCFAACITGKLRPHANAKEFSDEKYPVTEQCFQYLNYRGFVLEDLMVEDIYRKSLVTNLILNYPYLHARQFTTRSFVKEATSTDSLHSGYSYMDELSKLYTGKNTRADLQISTVGRTDYLKYLPSYYRFYLVKPVLDTNHMLRYIVVDHDKVIDSLKVVGAKKTYTFFHREPSRGDTSGLIYLKSPSARCIKQISGVALIGVPDRLVVDQSANLFHPSNRFIVLNSNSFDYAKHVQTFYYHFVYEKLYRGTENFYFPQSFNSFVDKVKNVPSEKLIKTFFPAAGTNVVEEFLHSLLMAEYGCNTPPKVGPRSGSVYEFTFFSSLFQSNFRGLFDTKTIRITDITPQ